MLPQTKRINTELFKEIIQKGAFCYANFFVIRFLITKESSRFGISIPKKIANTAVLRNKIKRRIYSCIKKNEIVIKPGFSIIIIAKKGLEKLDFDTLSDEIKKNFVKCGFLK